MRELPLTLPAVGSILLVAWLMFHGLTAPAIVSGAADPSDPFRAAIADAAIRDDHNVYNRLNAINANNKNLLWNSKKPDELLVVTFVTTPVAEQYYSVGSHQTPGGDPRVWVTLAPELKRFCQRLGSQDPTARLKQYLGLRPDSANNQIVEMWVKKDDVFRPCPDPEVSDGVCQLRSTDPPPKVTWTSDYNRFLLHLYENSYRLPDGAPWTGLGYTYDWANGQHGIGASEYMLVPEAQYTVVSVTQPASYCTGG